MILQLFHCESHPTHNLSQRQKTVCFLLMTKSLSFLPAVNQYINHPAHYVPVVEWTVRGERVSAKFDVILAISNYFRCISPISSVALATTAPQNDESEYQNQSHLNNDTFYFPCVIGLDLHEHTSIVLTHLWICFMRLMYRVT